MQRAEARPASDCARKEPTAIDFNRLQPTATDPRSVTSKIRSLNTHAPCNAQ